MRSPSSKNERRIILVVFPLVSTVIHHHALWHVSEILVVNYSYESSRDKLSQTMHSLLAYRNLREDGVANDDDDDSTLDTLAMAPPALIELPLPLL